MLSLHNLFGPKEMKSRTLLIMNKLACYPATSPQPCVLQVKGNGQRKSWKETWKTIDAWY